MERSLLRELTDKRLKAYLKAKQTAPRYWATFFPLDYSDELTWEALYAESGNAIAADVISYDSSAPDKGRHVIGKASGEIAKMAVKRTMREKDFLMYKRLSKGVQGDTEKQKILNLVFGDVDFVVNAIDARCEHLALQAASTGRIFLTSKNNNGIVMETAVGLGIPEDNKTCVSKLLTNADFDFFTEVKQVKAASKKTGTVKYIFMDEDTFDIIVETPKVKAAYGYLLTGTKGTYEGDMFIEDLNKLMTKKRLPTIILIESSDLSFEDEDHVRHELEGWKPGYITFAIDKKFGRMQHGPIAEEDAESVKKYAIQAKKGHVLVTKWSDVDPVCEKTKGEAHCFTVIDNPGTFYILNTNSTSKFID